MKEKIHVGKTAGRRKSARMRVGARPNTSGRVVYAPTPCSWSLRQTAAQVRR